MKIFEKYCFGLKLTLIYSNSFSASIAILGKHAVKTSQTIRSSLPHDVPLAPKVTVAFETCEVFHMPSSALGLGTLVRENNLKQQVIVRTLH